MSINIPKLSSNEPITSPDLPLLIRSESGSIIDYTIAQNIEKIIKESITDKILHNIIAQRQKEFIDTNIEVQKMNESLNQIQKPEEMRRKRYQIDEFLRTKTENLINDLIDQLHCAHIPGFESAKKLQKIFEKDINTLEKYRTAQREIVSGLLKAQLPSFTYKEAELPQLSKFEQLMDKKNPKNIYSKIEKTIEKFKNLKVEARPIPSPSVLYGIVKVIIDGTLANCEYTPGQQIDHVGGGTNPELLKNLLKDIKGKYRI